MNLKINGLYPIFNLAGFSIDKGDYKYVALFLIILLALTCLIGVVLILIHYFSAKKQGELVYYNTAHTRVYRMDFNSGTVVYFDKQNMSKRQSVTTIDAFYRNFYIDNQSEKLKTWIEDYVSGKPNSSNFITIGCVIRSKKEKAMAVFRITEYNPKLRILHFENTLLPRINSKSKGHTGSNFSYITTLKDVENTLKNKKYRNRIVPCYVLKLIPFVGDSTTQTGDTTNSVTSIYQPLNSVYRFLNKNRQMVFLDDEQAAIFDFSFEYRSDVHALCNHLLGEVQKFFNIKSLNNLYDISIGVGFYDIEKSNVQSLNQVVQIAKDLADNAQNKEEKYLIEGDVASLGLRQDSVELSDIKNTIRNKTFKITFTPVVSLELPCPSYGVTVVPFGSGFDNFDDLIFASDRQGLLVNLLSKVFDGVFQNMSLTKKQNALIILPYQKIDSIIAALKKNKNVCSKIILTFEISEIHSFYQADADLDKQFQTLKNLGVKTCLSFDVNSTEWTNEVLALFDMFLVGLTPGSILHTSERETNHLILTHSLLAQFGKPIIIDDLDSYADLELAYQLHYKTFICKKIAPSSSSPYDPDEFWKTKLGSKRE